MSHAPWPSSAFRTVALTAVCLLVSACATGPTAPRPVFIPDFTFVWQNQADSTNRYNLNTDQFDVESGVLEGEEEKVLNGDTRVTFSPLEGRFDGRSLDFTVDRDDSDTMVDCDDGEGTCVTFSGSFRDDDTIDLTSSVDGPLTLIRITDV